MEDRNESEDIVARNIQNLTEGNTIHSQIGDLNQPQADKKEKHTKVHHHPTAEVIKRKPEESRPASNGKQNGETTLKYRGRKTVS